MRLPGLRDPEWVRAQYRGEVSYLDGELGRLLESPRFAQGIIAVTGDHGESLGEHAIWWDHKGLYPNCLRVPLILAWPGCARPASRAAACSAGWTARTRRASRAWPWPPIARWPPSPTGTGT